MTSGPLNVCDNTLGKNRVYYAHCKAFIREFTKEILDCVPKTMKSDSKTMDRHMLSCRHVDKHVMNWPTVDLCDKRVYIDYGVPVIPGKITKAY